MNLAGIDKASGISAEHSILLDECVSVLNANLGKHTERRLYYEDKVRLKDRGMKVSKDYAGECFATGWPAVAVDALAERSIIDSFAIDDCDVKADFERSIAENHMKEQYQMGLPSMLVEGCGFWTVVQDDEVARPRAVSKYLNAMTSSGVWDYKHDRLRACFVVNDMRRMKKDEPIVPSECVLFVDDGNYVFTRIDDETWKTDFRQHPYGRVMAVPMVFQRYDGKPFGRSRITRAVKNYTLRAMEELRNMTIQSDYFSIPMKYVLGLSNDEYDELSENLHDTYRAEMLLTTTNDDGQAPTPGIIQAADMTPHIAVLNKLAEMMSSETKLPSSTFGATGNGYTSSDSLRASSDDLVMLAKSMNMANGLALKQVAQMMIGILGNKSFDDLTDEELGVSVNFADVEMKSAAARADAAVKWASPQGAEWIAGTDEYLEELGLPEDKRKRMLGQKAKEEAKRLLEESMTGIGAVADEA